jgi:glycosyltransferase involved in cell wall biosynthesis
MRILLINHYAGSPRHGMEFRPYYFAREWVKAGHQVTIVAGSHSHLRTRQPECCGPITQEELDGIRYLWLETPEYAGNGGRRAANIFTFVAQLWRFRRRICAEIAPEIVIASSTYPLDTVPALSIARACSALFIHEVHDLWPLSPIELGGMSPRHPFILLMQWAENFAYRHADRLVCMLPGAEPHMRSHGLAEGKFVYVPNGIDLESWGEPAATLGVEYREALESARRQGRFIVGYAGSHGLANAMEWVIRAASLLRDSPVTFMLVGQGAEKERLRQLAVEIAPDNVQFLPPVPKASIPALLAAMDALVISWQSTPLYRFGVSPNKLMDYMMAGRPVIQAIDASNDLVSESGCGVTVPAEDPAAIAGAVLQLMNLNPEARSQMGECGRRYVRANHDYRFLASRFLAVAEATEAAT